MNKCIYIKNNNDRCNSFAMVGEDYCFFHSQNTIEERKKAVLAGGNSPKRNYENEEVTVRSTKDIVILIEKTINELRKTRTSSKIANTVGYLAGISLKAIEQSDVEKRLEVLEYALKIKK